MKKAWREYEREHELEKIKAGEKPFLFRGEAIKMQVGHEFKILNFYVVTLINC